MRKIQSHLARFQNTRAHAKSEASISFSSQAEQIETLRRLINWFWHDLSHHFITPLAPGQLWSAYGAIEHLRLTCVNLARLRQNFQAAPEGYEKVERALLSRELKADLLQHSWHPTSGRIIRGETGNFIAFEGELGVFFRQHDVFVGGRERRDAWENEGSGVSSGNAHGP